MNFIKVMDIQKNKEVAMQISGGKLDYGDRNAKNKKLSRIVLILIVVSFIIMVAIMCTIIYLQKNVLKIYIDGVSTSLQEDVILIDEQTRKNICRYKRNCKILGI